MVGKSEIREIRGRERREGGREGIPRGIQQISVGEDDGVCISDQDFTHGTQNLVPPVTLPVDSSAFPASQEATGDVFHAIITK